MSLTLGLASTRRTPGRAPGRDGAAGRRPGPAGPAGKDGRDATFRVVRLASAPFATKREVHVRLIDRATRQDRRARHGRSGARCGSACLTGTTLKGTYRLQRTAKKASGKRRPRSRSAEPALATGVLIFGTPVANVPHVTAFPTDHLAPAEVLTGPAPLAPVAPAPTRSPAEEARTLVAQGRMAALATTQRGRRAVGVARALRRAGRRHADPVPLDARRARPQRRARPARAAWSSARPRSPATRSTAAG